MTKEFVLMTRSNGSRYRLHKGSEYSVADNCLAHGKNESLPKVKNMRIEFLSPNSTSKVQPLDAGIITWVKAKFRRRLLFRVFDKIDAAKKFIYNEDVLMAIRWTTEEWNGCPASDIHNYFTHCLRQAQGSDTDMEQEVEIKALRSMSMDAQ